MDSKGDVKQFFGMRFAWHGLESCCCSGVSEPASKGLAPMVSELRPQLRCRTKALVFMGSKGNGKHFVGPGFAWHGLSILSDLRLQGTCANLVSNQPRTEGAGQKNCFLWVPKVTGSFAEMMSERRVIWLYRPERFVFYGFQR